MEEDAFDGSQGERARACDRRARATVEAQLSHPAESRAPRSLCVVRRRRDEGVRRRSTFRDGLSPHQEQLAALAEPGALVELARKSGDLDTGAISKLATAA